MKYLIAPSILAADFARIGEEVDRVLDSGADIIHFDVMDNHFVPNLTFGASICKALRKYGIDTPIDVHLMTYKVDDLIRQFADADASWISFHPEASVHIDRTIQLIKDLKMRAGIAINPATSLSVLDHVLPELDFVLLMSVNPGFGGQKFINYVLDKIKILRQKIDYIQQKTNKIIDLQVDGGICVDNIAQIASAGANVFVAGSAIFSQKNYRQVIGHMREEINKSAFCA